MNGTKTIKHDNHEHITRTVNEDVLGLLIDDRETSRISEAFAWSDEDFEKVVKSFTAFWKFQLAAEDLDEDLPRTTKISSLADYLKSNNFKRLGIKIITPNDYFMLGYAYCAALSLEKDRRARENNMPMGLPMGMPPDVLLSLLKSFRKFLEERGGQ